MRKSQQDIWSGISFILIGVVFGVQYGDLTGVSRVFPEILISVIILGGVYFLIKGIIQNYLEKKNTKSVVFSQEEKEHDEKIKSDIFSVMTKENTKETISWSRIFIISVLAVVLVFALEYIGFFVSSTVFTIVSYLLLGDRTLQRSLLVRALIFAIPFIFLVWVLFVKLLNVPTPTGILF